MERGSVVCTPKVWVAQSDMYRYAPSPSQPKPAVTSQEFFFLLAPVYPSLHRCDSGRPQLMRGWTVPPFFFSFFSRARSRANPDGLANQRRRRPSLVHPSGK